jgi:hypothetical protein
MQKLRLLRDVMIDLDTETAVQYVEGDEKEDDDSGGDQP